MSHYKYKFESDSNNYEFSVHFDEPVPKKRQKYSSETQSQNTVINTQKVKIDWNICYTSVIRHLRSTDGWFW